MSKCPVCSCGKDKKFKAGVCLGSDARFNLAECTSCGVAFFDPLPGPAQLDRFYASSYYDFDRSREEGKGMAFARGLRRWRPGGRFLDVGCATGFFMNGIQKHSDWEVYGIDFGESAASYAREKLGLNVRRGELADADFLPGFFDYIHVNNVLEHVTNPVALMQACRRIIKPDGIMYLSVPNGANDSLGLINFYKSEGKPAFSHKGHIFFFPARALLAMIENAGFSVMKQKTYGFKRGWRNAGLLPKKRNWKAKHYSPAKDQGITGEVIPPEPKTGHTDFYYRWRYLWGNLKMIPGLYRHGLDFMFLLKPDSLDFSPEKGYVD